jgi:hypothetical protein
MVNTVLPPNSPSCAIGASEESDGVYSAGSLHPGGAMSMVADGSVRFINADIDAGDSRTATLTAARMSARAASPFGVWGALGTASSAEDVAVP